MKQLKIVLHHFELILYLFRTLKTQQAIPLLNKSTQLSDLLGCNTSYLDLNLPLMPSKKL